MTKEEQKALARASVAERRTLIERWGPRSGPVSPLPSERARLVASFIRAPCRVMDLGCGRMHVEAYLPAGSHYIPVDVAARDDRTVVVDLNVAPLPDLRPDVVTGLGVLEYLIDVPGLLRQIKCDAIFTYAPQDRMPTRDRAASGWMNDYTTGALSTLMESVGFQIDSLVPCPGNQLIWNLKRN